MKVQDIIQLKGLVIPERNNPMQQTKSERRKGEREGEKIFHSHIY